jgi:hypothetical protein
MSPPRQEPSPSRIRVQNVTAKPVCTVDLISWRLRGMLRVMVMGGFGPCIVDSLLHRQITGVVLCVQAVITLTQFTSTENFPNKKTLWRRYFSYREETIWEQSFASFENENWEDRTDMVCADNASFGSKGKQPPYLSRRLLSLLSYDIAYSGRHLFQRNLLSPFRRLGNRFLQNIGFLSIRLSGVISQTTVIIFNTVTTSNVTNYVFYDRNIPYEEYYLSSGTLRHVIWCSPTFRNTLPPFSGWKGVPRKWGWSTAGLDAVEKMLPRIEARFPGRTTRSLVTVLTELSRKYRGNYEEIQVRQPVSQIWTCDLRNMTKTELVATSIGNKKLNAIWRSMKQRKCDNVSRSPRAPEVRSVTCHAFF